MMMILPQKRFLPGDTGYSRGAAKTRTVRRLKFVEGGDERAERAAIGRMLYFQQAVPQRDATSIEAIAWYRESGCIPGYRNRHWRRRFSGR